ncbi:MAG TPA: aquaporin [Kofleriaceae bacterium]
MTAARKLVAEGLGTLLLVAAVVGSGIMGVNLAGGNLAIALLANTLATAAALVTLILVFGPISGAHFNPVVTLVAALRGELAPAMAIGYATVQIAGAIAGAVLANVMFDLDPVAWATTERTGAPKLASEVVATFGLVGVVIVVSRVRPAAVPFAVAGFITAAYWFTASTSFANPAVTLGRAFSDTFTGIRPSDVPLFVAAQLGGGLLALGVFGWLVRPLPSRA